MKTVLIAALLISTAAFADDAVPLGSITGCAPSGCTFITTVIVQPPWYTYEPKDDITVRELSEIVTILFPAVACRNHFNDCGAVGRIEKASPEVQRHFVRHEH